MFSFSSSGCCSIVVVVVLIFVVIHIRLMCGQCQVATVDVISCDEQL